MAIILPPTTAPASAAPADTLWQYSCVINGYPVVFQRGRVVIYQLRDARNVKAVYTLDGVTWRRGTSSDASTNGAGVQVNSVSRAANKDLGLEDASVAARDSLCIAYHAQTSGQVHDAIRAFASALASAPTATAPAPADAEQPRAGGAEWVGPINGRKVRLALGTATITLFDPGETKYVHERGRDGCWTRAVLREKLTMSDALDEYRKLENKLRALRGRASPGSPAEDPILEAMETTWWLLMDDERALLDDEGPQCWPDLESPQGAPRDVNVWTLSLKEPPRKAAARASDISPSGYFTLARDLGVSNAPNVFLAAVNAFIDATPQTIISRIQDLLDTLKTVPRAEFTAPDGRHIVLERKAVTITIPPTVPVPPILRAAFGNEPAVISYVLMGFVWSRVVRVQGASRPADQVTDHVCIEADLGLFPSDERVRNVRPFFFGLDHYNATDEAFLAACGNLSSDVMVCGLKPKAPAAEPPCPGCGQPTRVCAAAEGKPKYPACVTWRGGYSHEEHLVSRLAHKPGFQLRPPRVELLLAVDDQSEPP